MKKYLLCLLLGGWGKIGQKAPKAQRRVVQKAQRRVEQRAQRNEERIKRAARQIVQRQNAARRAEQRAEQKPVQPQNMAQKAIQMLERRDQKGPGKREATEQLIGIYDKINVRFLNAGFIPPIHSDPPPESRFSSDNLLQEIQRQETLSKEQDKLREKIYKSLNKLNSTEWESTITGHIIYYYENGFEYIPDAA